jgi:hypothetical protein
MTQGQPWCVLALVAAALLRGQQTIRVSPLRLHPKRTLRPRVGQHPLACNRFLNVGATGLPTENRCGALRRLCGVHWWPFGAAAPLVAEGATNESSSHCWAVQAYSSQFRRTLGVVVSRRS